MSPPPNAANSASGKSAVMSMSSAGIMLNIGPIMTPMTRNITNPVMIRSAWCSDRVLIQIRETRTEPASRFTTLCVIGLLRSRSSNVIPTF